MIRYIDILLPAFLILLPAVQLLRDWKFADRRTTVHQRITRYLLVFLLLCGGLTTYTAWQRDRDMRTTKQALDDLLSLGSRKPDLTLYLNNKLITGNDWSTAITQGEPYTLEFSIMNSGEATATDLQFHLWLNSNAGVFEHNPSWGEAMGVARADAETLTPSNDKHIFWVAPGALHPSSFHTLHKLSWKTSTARLGSYAVNYSIQAQDGTARSGTFKLILTAPP